MPLTGHGQQDSFKQPGPGSESREVASVSLLVKQGVRSPRHRQPWRPARSVIDRILGHPQPGESLAKGFHMSV